MDKLQKAFRIVFYPEPKPEDQWQASKLWGLTIHKLPHRGTLFYGYQIFLIIIFGILHLFTGDSISNAEGLPATKVVCTTSAMNSCGFNAQNCEPFQSTFVVKCPAKCMMKRAWTPIFVGKRGVQYTPFVVGDEVYRGDSWICQAALHQGIISNEQGGCVMVQLSPSQGETFSSSTKNGITSFDFNSTYPAVMKLRKPDSSFACGDMTITSQVIFAILLSPIPFFGPTRKQFYVSMAVWVFAFWGFLSADVSNSVTDISEMMSALIPYSAVCFTLYKLFLEDYLPEPSDNPFELSVLFHGGLWLGLYLDFLFELLPPLPPMSFDRNMFRNASGATVLIVVLVGIAILAIYYLYQQRKKHQLFNVLISYGTGFPVYILLGSYLKLVSHLHHYISALLLVPPVLVKNRFSLVLVAMLFGWYAQGVIKYGFDSPFDTVEGARVRNGRTFGTQSNTWLVNGTSLRQGTLSWSFPFPLSDSINVNDLLYSEPTTFAGKVAPTSYSLYLNDIEVYRGKHATWNFTTSKDINIRLDPRLVYYARVAPVMGRRILDYGRILEFRMADGYYQEYEQFKN